jgi:hypothetical protein
MMGKRKKVSKKSKKTTVKTSGNTVTKKMQMNDTETPDELELMTPPKKKKKAL